MLSTFSVEVTSRLSNEARIEILKMTSRAKASHVGSALSIIDVLSTLYSGIADISPENCEETNRDIIILSKGHAASALYAVLALKSFFPKEYLDRYCQNESPLGGHVTHSNLKGIELSTGSLGHGLPYGVGIAFSRKVSGTQGRIFVIVSDGECDEGTTWESALFANHHRLDNLVVIVDRNRIQSLKGTEETLKLEPFSNKWHAFGWEVIDVDGHNFQQLADTLTKKSSRPLVIIANTIKGKGVNFMENSVLWHYRSPNESELNLAIDSLRQQQ